MLLSIDVDEKTVRLGGHINALLILRQEHTYERSLGEHGADGGEHAEDHTQEQGQAGQLQRRNIHPKTHSSSVRTMLMTTLVAIGK